MNVGVPDLFKKVMKLKIREILSSFCPFLSNCFHFSLKQLKKKNNKNKRSEVLVNNLFLFRRFDDHGHHYQEK